MTFAVWAKCSFNATVKNKRRRRRRMKTVHYAKLSIGACASDCCLGDSRSSSNFIFIESKTFNCCRVTTSIRMSFAYRHMWIKMTSNRQVITFVLMLSITMMSISAYPAMETDDVWRLIRTIRHPQELPAVVPQHRNLHQQYEYGQPQARAKSEASDYADYNDLMLLLDDTRDAVDSFDLKKALLSRQLGRGLSAPFFAASSRNPVWVPEDVPAEYDSGAGVWYDQVAQDGSESEDSEGVKSSLTEMLNNLAENRNENAEHKRSERGREVSTASTATVTTTAIPEAGQKEVAMMRPASPSRLSQHNAKMAATSDGGNRKRKMAATGSSSVISYQDDLTEELDNLKRTMN